MLDALDIECLIARHVVEHKGRFYFVEQEVPRVLRPITTVADTWRAGAAIVIREQITGREYARWARSKLDGPREPLGDWLELLHLMESFTPEQTAAALRRLAEIEERARAAE
jgi:hypothetical protein